MLMINANSATNSVLYQEGRGHTLRHRNMISWQVVERARERESTGLFSGLVKTKLFV